MKKRLLQMLLPLLFLTSTSGLCLAGGGPGVFAEVTDKTGNTVHFMEIPSKYLKADKTLQLPIYLIISDNEHEIVSVVKTYNISINLLSVGLKSGTYVLKIEIGDVKQEAECIL